MRRPSLHLLSRFLLLLCLSRFINASSSLESSYTAVTALDKYGNSVQLEHARQAAARHGRTLVAAVCVPENAVVVASVHRPKPGVLTKNKKVVHRLSLHSGGFVACTGVRGDAAWLMETLREYATRVWERYNVDEISSERYSHAVSQAMLEFMKYNRQDEYTDGAGPVVMMDDEERDPGWARPLGVQAMVLTPSSSSSSCLTVIEPSGIPFQPKAFAMGKDSQLLNELLRKRYSVTASSEEIQQLLVDILQETLQEPSNGESIELVLEIVTKDGVDVSHVPLIPSRK